jgi:serine/threonine protein kinase
VYSYGVVLLELLTGKEPCHDPSYGEALDVVAWVKERVQLNEGRVCKSVLDPRLLHSKDAAPTYEMLCVQEIALLCTQKNPADRPTMRDVESMLETLPHEAEEASEDGDMKHWTVKGDGAKTKANNRYEEGWHDNIDGIVLNI